MANMDQPSESGSVTIWLDKLKAGDPSAAKSLWDAYFVRVVSLARQRLGVAPRVAADEEDVALSAFDSFCRAAGKGRFPQLDDRDDLWRLLFAITSRKAAGLIRSEICQSRGAGLVRQASAIETNDSSLDVLNTFPCPQPSPDISAAVSDECARLLTLLGEGEFRAVAVWKLEGYTNEEIAGMLGCSLPTVERRLRFIREIWKSEA